MIGEIFGRLEVLDVDTGRISSKTYYRCECECGAVVSVRRDHLRSGRTQSCGCYRREVSIERFTVHRGQATRLYRIWKNMKARCGNPNVPNYKAYGARGIRVCQEWVDDFEAFRDWALANGYREDLSIDRIDNDGPYSPDNCRWASAQHQAVNRSSSHFVTVGGADFCLSDAAKLLGVRYETLRTAYQQGKHEQVIDAALARQRKRGRVAA